LTVESVADGYKVPSVEEILKARAHLGHPAKRWHPKMKSYIASKHNKSHLIDPAQTHAALERAAAAAYNIAADGGQMLIVGTKTHAKQIVKDEARRGGMWHVNERWMGGTLTNFDTIERRIKQLIELDNSVKSAAASGVGELETRTELRRLNKFFDGLKEMDKLPELLFVVDINREKIAVSEAQIAKVPTIAIVDTDSDPTAVDYPIPANDDSLRSIRLILSTITDAMRDGRKEFGRRREVAMAAALEAEMRAVAEGKIETESERNGGAAPKNDKGRAADANAG